METQKIKPGTPGWNDIIFEGRNKNYGAYTLRRDYDKRAITGFIFAAGLLILITGAGTIKGWLGLETFELINPHVNSDPRVMKEVIFEIEAPKSGSNKEKSEASPVNNEKPIQSESFLIAATDSIETGPDIVEDTAGSSTPGSPGPGKGPDGPGKPGDGSGGGGDGNGSGYDQKVFDIPEIMPTFPGGETELFKYLKRSLRYPKLPLNEGREAVVYVAFVVMPSGEIGEISMLNKNGFGFEEEVERVVSKMPTWEPGTVDGQPVAVRFKMPVRFTLSK
jgi:protein TonB